MNWSLHNKRVALVPETDREDDETSMAVKKSIQVAVRFNHEQLAWIDGEALRLQEMIPEANRSTVLRALVHAAMKRHAKQPKPKSKPGT